MRNRSRNALLEGYNRVFEGGPGSGPQGDGEGGAEGGGGGGGSAGGGGGAAGSSSTAAPASSPGLLSRMGTAVKNFVAGTPKERAHAKLATDHENAMDVHSEALAEHGDINYPEVKAAKAKVDSTYAALTPKAVQHISREYYGW